MANDPIGIFEANSLGRVPGTGVNDERIIAGFDFNTPSPLLLDYVISGGTITGVEMIIDTVFDGTTPSLTVGTVANPDAYMQANENIPTLVATYIVGAKAPSVASGTVVNLYLNLTSATQGVGRVIIEITR